MKKLEDCKHVKKYCAANHGGKCIALDNTEFGRKPCPFYMDRQTKQKRIVECYNRWLATGYIIKK